MVYDNEEEQIWLDKLANNSSVYNNNITGGLNGIRISERSASNTIDNNTIANSYLAGIFLLNGTSKNTITSNTINNSNYALFILDQDLRILLGFAQDVNTDMSILKAVSSVNSKMEEIAELNDTRIELDSGQTRKAKSRRPVSELQLSANIVEDIDYPS